MSPTAGCAEQRVCVDVGSADGLRDEPVEEQPAGLGRAAVEAEGELVEVVGQVLWADAVVQGAEDAAFTSHFIAHSSAGLTAGPDFPKGIEGKAFTFGSRASTSGRVFPEHHIRLALGKAPEQAFSRVGFSGDHSKTIQLVQSGAYQVGAVDRLVFENAVKNGKVDPKDVTIIWTTPPFPDYHWVVRGDMDKTFGAGFKDKLVAAMLAVDDPKMLAVFDRTKFIPTKNENYKVIEEVGKLSGLLN